MVFIPGPACLDGHFGQSAPGGRIIGKDLPVAGIAVFAVNHRAQGISTGIGVLVIGKMAHIDGKILAGNFDPAGRLVFGTEEVTARKQSQQGQHQQIDDFLHINSQNNRYLPPEILSRKKTPRCCFGAACLFRYRDQVMITLPF